jgi:hypothetical protein
MSERPRWSEASSDADPVLRAVMRYAQDIQPAAQDVATLAASMTREESRAKARAALLWGRGRSRRALAWIGALAAVGGAGIALGMSVSHGSGPGAQPLVVSPDRTAPLEPKRAPVVVPRLEAALPEPIASSAGPVRARPVVSTFAVPTTAPRAPVAGSVLAEPGLGAARELALLGEARRQLKSGPARTLTLLGDHVRLFPKSAFGEERAELRIEALFGLGRRSEAELELDAFEATYPSSIYALRLAAARQR